MLAAILRRRNAGANNAADHLDLFGVALEQLPREALDGPILARSDSAGASHALADACRETAVRFSFGYAINERVREAIMACPKPRGGRRSTARTRRATVRGRPS